MRNQRGITLIALAVTIIVLIILAGVTITLAIQSNGLFKKAEEAQKYQENAAAYDDQLTENVEYFVDDYVNDVTANQQASGD